MPKLLNPVEYEALPAAGMTALQNVDDAGNIVQVEVTVISASDVLAEKQKIADAAAADLAAETSRLTPFIQQAADLKIAPVVETPAQLTP